MCKRVCLLGGLGAYLPQENFEFRSSQIASDTIWDKLSKQHFDDTYIYPVRCKIDGTTIITILNFKISGAGGGTLRTTGSTAQVDNKINMDK